jgi:hypothetical protein
MQNRYLKQGGLDILECMYVVNHAMNKLMAISKDRRTNSHEYEVLEAVYWDVIILTHYYPLVEAHSILNDTELKPRLNAPERGFLEQLRMLNEVMDYAWTFLDSNESRNIDMPIIDRLDVGEKFTQQEIAARNIYAFSDKIAGGDSIYE